MGCDEVQEVGVGREQLQPHAVKRASQALRHCAEGENEAVIETSHEILKNNLIQV